MSNLLDVIVKILKSKASIIPVFWCDLDYIFNDTIKNITSDIDILPLESKSNIAVTSIIKNINTSKHSAIYSNFDICIDAYIAAQKLVKLEIDARVILSNYENFNDKIEGKIELTVEQFRLFIKNFDYIVDCLKIHEVITNENIKEYLSKVFLGRYNTPREMLISFIKGELNINSAKSLYLFDKIINIIKVSFDIDISEMNTNIDLFEKIFITLLRNEDKENFKTEYSDKLINVKEETLNKLLVFIIQNTDDFSLAIAKLNRIFEDYPATKLTYVVPQLFINYISQNMKDYKTLEFDKSKLWTEESKRVARFIDMLKEINDLLMQYVGYSFPNTTMNDIINEYKQKLYKLDTLFRNINICITEFTFEKHLYKKIIDNGIVSEIRDKYFNVISNINGKYITGYNNLYDNPNTAISQFDFIKQYSFRDQTLFIFADGLRYELAKEIISEFEDVNDMNLYSLLPSETEVCMNGYFITDERVKLNDKNVFELKKDEKTITQINCWRTEKLAQILKTNVISFDDFKKLYTYQNSVICFYNDVDHSMHNFDDVSKVSASAYGIKNIIRYAKSREFDVCLLSDHGFIEVKEKIIIPNKDIESDKKKGRYIILSSNEPVETSFYSNKIPLPKFIDTQDRKICFINSINTLKSTSNYTHGGISLQENVITAFLIKATTSNSKTPEKCIKNIMAFNEIIADISNAVGSECSVYFGSKKIFAAIISEPIYRLQVPIRSYNKNDEFLVTLNINDQIEKVLIKKSGNTVIEKDLDIF